MYLVSYICYFVNFILCTSGLYNETLTALSIPCVRGAPPTDRTSELIIVLTSGIIVQSLKLSILTMTQLAIYNVTGM